MDQDIPDRIGYAELSDSSWADEMTRRRTRGGITIMGQLTDRAAAGLLLRTLLSENAAAEVRSLVVTCLEPRDMFQVEYMMILAAAQRLHQTSRPINLAGLESELAAEDPAGFARIVLRSVHENRNAGPTEKEDVQELVRFLVGFRNLP